LPGVTSARVRWFVVPAVAVALLVLNACGDDPPDTETVAPTDTTAASDAGTDTTQGGSSSAGAGELDGTTWTIVSLEGADGTLEAPADATIRFAQDGISVATGCNSGFGPATVGAGTVTFGPLALTRMACTDELGEWESALGAFLDGELSYELTDDQLVLTNADGATLTLSAA
jgi:heat shock protein HslJ